jgi:hypothetical protein
MGGVNSTPWTASPAGSRSPSNLQIKRRKSIAAEKMYREHYRRKNGVEGRHFLEGSVIETLFLIFHSRCTIFFFLA